MCRQSDSSEVKILENEVIISFHTCCQKFIQIDVLMVMSQGLCWIEDCVRLNNITWEQCPVGQSMSESNNCFS